MRIKSVSFRNVGPFGAEGIRLDGFTPGLNVVCETNEFGKSTVLKALEIILFKPFSSKHKDVKAIRTANSNDGIEGEITFSSEGRDYRFSKRFLKSTGARLQDENTGEELALDRAAEEALAKLLRSDQYESGPSGLLWVRQGKSMEGIADNGQIASRLEGELGTLIGGERARDYLDRVKAELSEVLTASGKEKKGGVLNLAREAVEATEAELNEAKRLRDMTLTIGTELSQVQSEIERISRANNDQELSEQIEATRTEMMAARRFADELALIEARHEQAMATAERTAARQTDYIAALVSYNDTIAKLNETKTEYAAQIADVKKREARRAELRQSVTKTEAKLEALSRERAKRETFARNALHLENLQKERLLLSARLEDFTALEDAQSKLTEQLSDLPAITRADVEALRRAANEVRQCESELAGFTTHLYLDVKADGRGKISLDGEPLGSGPLELPGGAALSIEGIGTLRSDDSRLREGSRALEAARADYAALTQRLSADDPAEASKFADQRQTLETERKAITSDMARLAPEGRAAIEAESNRLESAIRDLANSLEEAGAELVEADDSDVLDALRAQRAKLDIEEKDLTAAKDKLSKLETQQARLRERLAGLNLPEDEAARQKQADALAGEKLKADADVRALAAQVAAQKAKAPDQPLDMLTARLTRLEAAASNTRQTLETLKTKAAGLQARRDAAFEGGDAEAAVATLEARLRTHQASLDRHVRETDVRILLRDTLVETQTRLREAYTAPVTEELAPLLSRVIPGAEAGLGDSLGVDTVLRGGKRENISQLSGGTQEQFAILTRLAYARLLARSGTGAPVILDDALVYADDARRDAMFDVLGLVSSGEMPIQIVYLSCHAGATARLGGTRITPRPW